MILQNSLFLVAPLLLVPAAPLQDCSHLTFFSPFEGEVDQVDVASSSSTPSVAIAFRSETSEGKRIVCFQTQDPLGFPRTGVQVLSSDPMPFGAGPVVADVADGSLFVIAWLETYGSVLKLAAMDASTGLQVASATFPFSTSFSQVEIGGSTDGSQALVALRGTHSVRTLVVRPTTWGEGGFEIGEEHLVDADEEAFYGWVSVSRGPDWLVAFDRMDAGFFDVLGQGIGSDGAPTTDVSFIARSSNTVIGFHQPSAGGEGSGKVVVLKRRRAGGIPESSILAYAVDLTGCSPGPFCTPSVSVELAHQGGNGPVLTGASVGMAGPDSFLVSWRFVDPASPTNPILALCIDALTLTPSSDVVEIGSAESVASAPVPAVVDAELPSMVVWYGSSCFTPEIQAQGRVVEACP